MNADLELKNGGNDRIFTDAERVKHDTHELDKQANIKKYIQLQDDYLKIDKAFEDELEAYRTSIARRCEICGWLKT
jgi:hypothetical protein